MGISQSETPTSLSQNTPSMPQNMRDAGDQTVRNYRYQRSDAVILLASARRSERHYQAIWCEHNEEILAERSDGKFDGWQISFVSRLNTFCRAHCTSFVIAGKMRNDPSGEILGFPRIAATTRENNVFTMRSTTGIPLINYGGHTKIVRVQ